MNTKRKVLILDDDPAVAKPLEIKLAEQGFDPKATIFVSDFEKALVEESWDAVVLDVYLPTPQGDRRIGLDIARRIRERQPGLPIVFVSGYLQSKLQIEPCARELGAKVVWKPLGKGEEVVKAIWSLIGGPSP